jgi:hypothetical protein
MTDRPLARRFNFQTAKLQADFEIVITGLDPVIHLLRRNASRRLMDARIKTGHDKSHSRDANRARGVAKTSALKNRGRGECRVPDAPAASCVKW